MGYFFDSTERQELLFKEVESWIGTPFRHWSGVKGMDGGCDCVHFVFRVLDSLGVTVPKVPRYEKDWNLHNDVELLYEGIMKNLNTEDVGKNASPKNGDLILYWYGRVRSHIGFFYDDHVYQSITDMGVERRHWEDPMWKKRLGTIVRILDVV